MQRRNGPQLLCSSMCLLTCERMSWLNRSVFVTRERLRSGHCFCTGRNSVANVVTRFAALGYRGFTRKLSQRTGQRNSPEIRGGCETPGDKGSSGGPINCSQASRGYLRRAKTEISAPGRQLRQKCFNGRI